MEETVHRASIYGNVVSRSEMSFIILIFEALKLIVAE